jgi:hypothetical protein
MHIDEHDKNLVDIFIMSVKSYSNVHVTPYGDPH